MFILAEDQLGEAILRRILLDRLAVEDAITLQKGGGGLSRVQETFYKANDLARREVVFCLIDLDSRDCEVQFRDEFCSRSGVGLLAEYMTFCIARREAESWLLADTDGIERYMNLPDGLVDPNSEMNTAHPKEYLVGLARKSKSKNIREALVPTGAARVGVGYNTQLTRFIEMEWDVERAQSNNRTLKRVVHKVDQLLT